MESLTPDELARLSADERLALIGQLWDSLGDADIPLPEAQRAELARRLSSLDQDRAELMDAHDWYEAKLRGLGTRFLDQVEITILRLQENPQQFPMVFQDVHRALLRKYPYGLFFRVEISEIVVIACFHGSRDPRRWERRI